MLPFRIYRWMHFRVRKERGHVVHRIVRAIALVGLTAALLVRKLIPWFNVEFLVNEQTPSRLTGSLDDLIDITRAPPPGPAAAKARTASAGQRSNTSVVTPLVLASLLCQVPSSGWVSTRANSSRTT